MWVILSSTNDNKNISSSEQGIEVHREKFGIQKRETKIADFLN